MGYIEDNLMPYEKILFTARVHVAIFINAAIGLLVTVFFIFLGFYFATQVNHSFERYGSNNSFLTLLVSVFAIIFLLAAVRVGVSAVVTYFSTEFAVTNRRIVAKTGFIRRHTLEMLLSKVESISVHQSLFGRMVKMGTVIVTGTGGTRESFYAIVDPITVRKKINQIIEDYNQTQNPNQPSSTFNTNVYQS